MTQDGDHEQGAGRDDRLEWATAECRRRGFRVTQALKATLRELVDQNRPATISDLSASRRLAGSVDPATVYRLLIRLERSGLIRRLGLHDRSAYFTMNYPGEHHDYLICTSCGSIDTLDISCPVEKLENEISRQSGFQRLYHELEFFGVCPACGP